MSKVQVKPFSGCAARLAPLATAVSLALYGMGVAHAATVTPLQLPGEGQVVGGGIGGSSFNNVTGVGSITNGGGNTVIDWGGAGGGPLNSGGIGGFNVGSSASMDFTGGGAVLNVDVSGNNSQILGLLQSSDASTNIYVANGNGIVVGSGATISAPYVALIGAPFSAATKNTFVAGDLVFDANQGATVDVQGGDWSNTDFAFIAGGSTVNVTWTQGMQPGFNSFGHTDADILGGVSYNSSTGQYIAADAPGTVNLTLLPNGPTPYNATHLWVLANGDLNLQAGSNVGVVASSGDWWQWTGTFTNDGTINADSNGLLFHPFDPADATPSFGFNVVDFTQADGTPIPFGGFTNNGLFSDTDPNDDWYALPDSIVNNGTFYYGVDIDGVRAGTWYDENPDADFINTGSFLPLGVGQLDVIYAGRNLTNDGTLRTQAASDTWLGAMTGDVTNTGLLEVPSDLEMEAYEGSVLAGGTVSFFNPGQGGLSLELWAEMGDVDWTADVLLASNTWMDYFEAWTEVGVVNIDAPVDVLADTSGDAVWLGGVDVNINQPVTVGMETTAADLGDVTVYSYGAAPTVSIGPGGSIYAGDVWFDADFGVVDFSLAGPITAMDNGGTDGDIRFFGLGGAVGDIIGAGPDSLLTANDIAFNNVTGDILSPGISATDWFLNSLHIATVGPDPWVSFEAVGFGPQRIKFFIDGDASLDSMNTNSVGCAGSGCVFGGLLPQFNVPPANRDSRLLVEATGRLAIADGDGAGVALDPDAFRFPGLTVFKGETIDIMTTVDNGFAETPANLGFRIGSGQWYESDNINIGAGGGQFFTTGTSWINFSSAPVGLSPIAWGVEQGFNETFSQYYLIQGPAPDASKLHSRSYDVESGLIED